MVVLGRIKEGKVQIQRFFKRDFVKLEGKEIEIKEISSSKTLQQLRYLWGVVFKIIADDTGFTPEEVSEVYKKKFLTYPREYKGKIYEFTKGISELTKKEMAQFIDKVIQHATSDLGLIIPDPEIAYEEF